MDADRALPTPPALLPDAVWRESGPVAGGPGLEYLERRGVWPGYPVPSVRWLTASAAVRVRLYPRLPLGAAGALVYRFTVPGELGAVRAVQVEAVDADGARLDSWRYWDRDLGLEVMRPTKRPSVAGSDTDGGRRVVPLAPSAPGVHVCEGPVDALGLVALEARGLVDLGGSAVIGVGGHVRPAGAGGRGVVRSGDDLARWRRPRPGRGGGAGGGPRARWTRPGDDPGDKPRVKDIGRWAAAAGRRRDVDAFLEKRAGGRPARGAPPSRSAATPTPSPAADRGQGAGAGRVTPQDRADRIRLQQGLRRQLALRPASTLKVRADPGRPVALEARWLVELRDRWLNPPEWVDWVDEPVPGYPDRPVARDEDAAKALRKRTLTNLYNACPQWLADAHDALDAAVAAAYGWLADIFRRRGSPRSCWR